ncbi:MAG: hypothetical protein KDA97_11580 [Acidimicrobiales bacterium]|nr:hypothetical protein [Acidimicrobiales bacterium]
MRRTLVLLTISALLATASCSSSDGSEGQGAGSSSGDEPTTTTEAPTEPLEDQTPPATINGLDVDGDALWIASIEGDEVIQVDRSSGALLARFPTDGAAPDDVAVADDGTVWVTGFGNGDLGRIVDGEYSVATTLEPSINPIALDPDGVLWIGTYGPDGSLYRIDPGELPTGSNSATFWSPVAEGTMPDINAFGILDDGTIVAPAGGIGGPGAAVAIDPATAEVTEVVGDLSPVAAGATDAAGTPYLLANVSGEVYEIDVEAGTARVVTTVTTGGPFDNLAFAPDGTLYLSSFVAPEVVEVGTDGTARTITIGS